MYYCSLNALSNQGTNKIRGIMLCPPKLVTLELNAQAFRRMENIKFLIVNNVYMDGCLEYLPNSLVLLDWPNCFFSLPSNFCPQQLVYFNMPFSLIRLEKVLNQVWLLVYMSYDFFAFYLKVC